MLDLKKLAEAWERTYPKAVPVLACVTAGTILTAAAWPGLPFNQGKGDGTKSFADEQALETPAETAPPQEGPAPGNH